MKALMIVGEGPNQKALANRINRIFPIRHLAIVQMPAGKAPRKPSSRILGAAIGLPLRRAWRATMRHYEKAYPDYPAVPLSRHIGVNSASVVELVVDDAHDVVLVSGTDLVRQQLIDTCNCRILNLHTGISPYIRGGPNCTNWALALHKFELIGNTMMWLDAGINTRNVIATEQTPLNGRESLSELHLKVMDHAHGLYCRVYKHLLDGDDIQAVSQESLGEGRLFYTRDWTPLQVARAVWNFHVHYSPCSLKAESPRLVLLP